MGGVGRSSVFELCGLFCQGSTWGAHSSLSPFWSSVAGWQGAELQATVHLTGRNVSPRWRCFLPREVTKSSFREKEGKQSVWPATLLSALCGARSFYPGLGTGRGGSGMHSNDPLFPTRISLKFWGHCDIMFYLFGSQCPTACGFIL